MGNETSESAQRPGSGDRQSARDAGAGVAGGVVASIPVLGPVLGAFCTSCLGIAGASVAGLAAGFGKALGIGIGVIFLGGYGWFVLRRARRRCSAEECRRLARRLRWLLGASGLASYLLATFVLVPLLRQAALQLSRAFTHVP